MTKFNKITVIPRTLKQQQQQLQPPLLVFIVVPAFVELWALQHLLSQMLSATSSAWWGFGTHRGPASLPSHHAYHIQPTNYYKSSSIHTSLPATQRHTIPEASFTPEVLHFSYLELSLLSTHELFFLSLIWLSFIVWRLLSISHNWQLWLDYDSLLTPTQNLTLYK